MKNKKEYTAEETAKSKAARQKQARRFGRYINRQFNDDATLRERGLTAPGGAKIHFPVYAKISKTKITAIL